MVRAGPPAELIAVGSLAEALAEPPPVTVTVLVTVAGAGVETLTVRVMAE